MSIPMGELIVPTSISGTGASVSSSGKITFTANTTLNVNGCFTSVYNNYLIVIRSSSTGDGTIYMKMRASGTDESGNNYVQQYFIADGTGVPINRQGPGDQWINTPISSTPGGSHLYLYGPNLVQQTAIRSIGMSGQSGAYIRDFSGTHAVSAAYDGFSLFGAYTGSLTIYGLSQ